MTTVQCHKCGEETAHKVLHSAYQQHQESSVTPEEIALAQEDPNFDESQVSCRSWKSCHELIQCGQCETISYRETAYEHGEEYTVLYPPRT